MLRLLADAEKLTGVKYDINNLDDVFNAIHVIQGELGITGTTAKEAKETLTGSFNAMKASLEDFGGALALGMDISGPVRNLISTTATFLFGNLLPMVGNIAKQIPVMIGEALNFGWEQFKGLGERFSFIKNIASFMEPAVEKLKSSFDSLMTNIRPFIQAVGNFLAPILKEIAAIIGGVLTLAISVLANHFQFLSKVAQVLTPVFNFLGGILNTISGHVQAVVGKIVEFGQELFNNQAVIDAYGILAEAVWKKIQSVIQVFRDVFEVIVTDIRNWLKSMGVDGQGLQGVMGTVWDAIKSAVSTARDILVAVVKAIATHFDSLGINANTLKAILLFAWNAIKAAVKAAGAIISGAIKVVVGVFNGLKTAGQVLSGALRAAWSAITGAISSAVSSIGGFIGRIKSAFNSLSRINLFDIGKSIIDGFFRGLKAAWGKVTGFIGGIAGWIRDHKGPIEYDRKLLIPAGKAIMGGLNKGLLNSFKDVKDNILGMAGEIYDGFKISPEPVEFKSNLDGFRDSFGQKVIDGNVRLNDYRQARDVKVDNVLSDILAYLKFLTEKDSDVYIDGEKASSILGYKIEEMRARKDKYEKRRGGILV